MADYATVERMNNYLSTLGVDAFSDHDHNLLRDDQVVPECITESTDEINLYVLTSGEYDLADLDGTNTGTPNTLLAAWGTVIACCCLCRRRGNPIPMSLAEACERVTRMLDEVRKSELTLPGVPRTDQGLPTWSNLQVWRGYAYRNIRVTPDSSPGTTSLTQNRVPWCS